MLDNIENLSEIKEINKEGDNLSISLISEVTNELKIDQSIPARSL